jgi:hypothetical protein
MMRRALEIVGAVWLCVTALQAPFMHLHPQDPEHRHATGFAHLHLGHDVAEQHASDQQPAWDHGDTEETTLWQEWIPAGSPRITIEHAVIEETLGWEPQLICLHGTPEFVLRSHDPPDLSYASARAPPV